jgi:hypothetical protein
VVGIAECSELVNTPSLPLGQQFQSITWPSHGGADCNKPTVREVAKKMTHKSRQVEPPSFRIGESEILLETFDLRIGNFLPRNLRVLSLEFLSPLLRNVPLVIVCSSYVKRYARSRNITKLRGNAGQQSLNSLAHHRELIPIMRR